MGEQRVSKPSDQESMKKFVAALLNDVQALEIMLEKNMFDTGITRIGAEQEMVLVDDEFRAAPMAMESLALMEDLKWVETEIAKFNLEINLDPRQLTKDCFSALEEETRTKLDTIQERIKSLELNIILTGILPTLVKSDLALSNLTPKKRYQALIEAINEQLIEKEYNLNIKGIDELRMKHDSPLIEACNTSFQVHLQVDPNDFVKMYNIAQAITGPVLAIAANSPLVFGKKLWHESRIALFQQSIDTRSTHDYARDKSARVSFGTDWLKESILDIYKEDLSRYRVLLSADVEEDALAVLESGKTPKLNALQVHNSTIYRWNRPCYGISPNGKPHLRIENRVFGAGPTIKDEVANATFWIGLMLGMADTYDDITKHLHFADVHDNFEKAARFGIDTTVNWIDDTKISVCDLILNELIPLARKGLKLKKVDKKDIDLYLGIIEARAKSHMNGARWTLRSYMKLHEQGGKDEALSALTNAMIENQKKGIPGHEWEAAKLSDLKSYNPKKLKVSGFMQTDLYTVHKNDIVTFVAELMNWKNIRYTPVENKDGTLAGLVSMRQLLKHFTRSKNVDIQNTTTVEEIMITDPITISPSATVTEAMKIMRDEKIGCLPVVSDQVLVGIITYKDYIKITRSFLERKA